MVNKKLKKTNKSIKKICIFLFIENILKRKLYYSNESNFFLFSINKLIKQYIA